MVGIERICNSRDDVTDGCFWRLWVVWVAGVEGACPKLQAES
jgi:hypothetical protein